MEDTIQKYHPLGTRTLVILTLRRCAYLFLLVPLFIGGIVSLDYIPAEYFNIVSSLLYIFLAFLIVATTFSLFLGWLEYIRYWIFVDDKDVKVARGLISTEQVGIPYRYVQDVKIRRSLMDQIFGVSDVIITNVGGDEDNTGGEYESTVILPALSKEIALEIQSLVLKKAQVEQINVLSGHTVVKQ